jgi:hypothetical protein
MLNDLEKLLKDSTQQVDGLKEVRGPKRHCYEEPARVTEKVAIPTSSVKVATKNFFVPF